MTDTIWIHEYGEILPGSFRSRRDITPGMKSESNLLPSPGALLKMLVENYSQVWVIRGVYLRSEYIPGIISTANSGHVTAAQTRKSYPAQYTQRILNS